MSFSHAEGMDSPVYRLPEHLPLVWTSATSIQVGIDPPRAHLDNIPDNAAPLLHALSQGTPASGLAMLARVHRVSADWVDHLVGALWPALNVPAPTSPLRLEAWSTSDAIHELSTLARMCGMEVTIPGQITDDTVPVGDTVMVVADYLVHPRWADLLSRTDVPHTPVIFSDQTVSVGPAVTPGHTPCLVCVESHRRDNTVGWLEISSQLWGKRSPLIASPHIGMAWALLLLLLSPGGMPGCEPGFTRASFSAVDRRITWEAIDFHPRCACRGLHTAQ